MSVIDLSDESTYPIVGDWVCHYEQREPLQVIRRMRGKAGSVSLFLKTRSGHTILAPLTNVVDFYPQTGDRVIVAASTYQQWLSDRLALAEGEYLERKRILEELEDSGWMAQVFTLKRISGLMGVIRSEANWMSKDAPIAALRVLERRRKTLQEESA